MYTCSSPLQRLPPFCPLPGTLSPSLSSARLSRRGTIALRLQRSTPFTRHFTPFTRGAGSARCVTWLARTPVERALLGCNIPRKVEQTIQDPVLLRAEGLARDQSQSRIYSGKSAEQHHSLQDSAVKIIRVNSRETICCLESRHS